MRSIQLRIVVLFLLLILLSMQFIGTYLLRALERYYVAEEGEKRIREAQLLAQDVGPFLTGTGEAPAEGARPGAGAPVPDPQRVVEELGRGRYVRMMVLDTSGTIIAAGDEARVGQRLLEQARVVEAMEQERAETYQRVDPETGRDRLGAAAPIRDGAGRPVGVALVEADLEVVEQTLAAIRQTLFTATLVALGVVGVLAWVVARTITRPIQAITTRAAEMAAGDFERRIEVRSRDELGRLAEMFNYLAGRLKETLAEMSNEKQKVEAILTHMADGVMAFDRAGRVLLMNPAARAMLDAGDEPEDPVGRTPDELWPDLDVAELLAGVLAEGGEGRREETLVIRRGERSLRTHLAPIESAGHSAAAGAVWVLHDVTELEKLENVRREFVANVSHELRTPLTTIKSYVETLLDERTAASSTRRRFLEVVGAETDRMVRLVRDLLDLSQLEFERARWEREYCYLSELAQQVLTKLQAQVAAKRQAATLETGRDEEPLVYVDPDRLQQVLVNILSNAVEYTPREGSITVRVEPGDRDVRVEVHDTGVGIPREDLPRIFDRFYRVDKARSRRLGGTGLGLSIARQIVEGHGGRIGIDSEPGRGTLIWFTIPVEPVGAAG